jgi:hypothetical protein
MTADSHPMHCYNVLQPRCLTLGETRAFRTLLPPERSMAHSAAPSLAVRFLSMGSKHSQVV